MADRESTSRRQYLRELTLDIARRAIHSKYCGTDFSGNNIWSFSRRIRRSMERDRAKNELKNYVTQQTTLSPSEPTTSVLSS